MATTYDKASLVMIPSGYKDDKLYSVKPTDGSGDFTFSRDGAGASPATRVNSDGNIEKGYTNELLYSNQPNNWSITSVSLTSGQTGYDGTNNAWLFDSSGGFIRNNLSVSGVYTYSIYAKQGTADGVRLRMDAGTDANVYISLTDGSESFPSTGISFTATDVGSGWWRISLTANDSAFSNFRVYAIDGSGGSTTGTIYIQDAMVNEGLVAQPYVESIATAVSAGLLGDMPRLDYSGGATCPSLLLEPSRVNVLPHSEYFGTWGTLNATIQSNAALSPEGVSNATELIPLAIAGFHNITYTPTLSAGTATFSFFAKANGYNWVRCNFVGSSGECFFDLANGVVGTANSTASIESFGNGWYKCIMTSTNSANPVFAINVAEADNDGNFTGDGTSGIYIYGAQAESGSYVSSYIPTYGSASTRGADSYYNNNLASLHDTANGFCLMFDYSEVEEADSAFQDYFSIQQAFNNDTGFRAEAAGASNSEWRLYTDNITSTLGFPMTISNIASRRKVLLKVESTGISLFADGALIKSQIGSVTIPTLGTLQPSRSTSQPALTGIKQSLGLVFFSPILTDAECIALTTI